jgi:C-terminal processing protease CtpA/Prc
VAAALQEHRRAIILGTRTSGAGTLQTFYTLNDGSALRLTNAVWQTPNGNHIDKNGILPDLLIISERDNSLSSLPSDRPKIMIDNAEKDATLRISLEILKKTSSGSFKDLIAAAKEVSDMEQQH